MLKFTPLILILIALSLPLRAQRGDSGLDSIIKTVNAYQPLPINQVETADYRWHQKPVRASRPLDNMESLDNWRCDILNTPKKGQVTLTNERIYEGSYSLKVTAATKGTDVGGNKGDGRPWEWVVLRRDFKGENWSDYNRLSVQIYPDFPGFRKMSVGLILYNEGAEPVPDSYYREGFNYVMLEPGRWNHLVWEIPQHARDKVTGIGIMYRTQGNEPEAADTISFYADKLELQRVDADHYEGWNSAPQTILYSHSGYQPQARKVAFTSDTTLTTFSLLDDETGQTVFIGPARPEKSSIGTFRGFDFSTVTKPGTYRIKAGRSDTPPFQIADDIWTPSIWKTINAFFCQRCGYAVPGIHGVCHRDWMGVHGDKRIALSGGWHDAGDVSQSLQNTAEGIYAMFRLSTQCRRSDPPLAARLVTEAKWGLDWLLKNRFEDGYRVNWTTIDFWSDGILGTVDDRQADAELTPLFSLKAAMAEAQGAMTLIREDSVLARHCRSVAVRDWQLAINKLTKLDLEMATVAATASLELYQLTTDTLYANKAIELAGYIRQCQQQKAVFSQMPLAGFFYKTPEQKSLVSYEHHVKAAAPIAPLIALCELFPAHPDWMNWYASIRLYTAYFEQVSTVTAPYYMLPSSIYSVQASAKPTYNEQVRNGIRLDRTHYLRRFPVWYGLRGNLSILLAHATGLASAGRFLGDSAARALAIHQLEWTVGRNPFNQSLMYGEGHNYAPQYTVLSGDMVGSLPVGIQTSGNRDVPYWSASNCYNYKEVWVHPSSHWLRLLDELQPDSRPRPASPLKQVRYQLLKNGNVTITADADAGTDVQIRPWNLTVRKTVKSRKIAGGVRTTWEARITSADSAWIAVVIPDGDAKNRKEVFQLPWSAVRP